MAAGTNSLTPLVVAYSSLRKLLQKAHISLQKAPSSRNIAPSVERDLLTFMAAVCSLHPDCDEVAVAVAKGTPPSVDATLYVAAIQPTASLRGAFDRFVEDLRAAYSLNQDIFDACSNSIIAAMYRLAYPMLRQCLWKDDRYQQVLNYFGKRVAQRPVQKALEHLRTITKESDSMTLAEDALRDLHGSCGIVHAFVHDYVERGTYFPYLKYIFHLSRCRLGSESVVGGFLTDIASVCIVASTFDYIISGACRSDKDVESLMRDTRGHRWNIIWIPNLPSPSAPFEAEVSASAVAIWLEEYSRCSSTLPWTETISEIASCCPEFLTKTGSHYTSDERPSTHREIALLLWLIHHDIPVDMHIGYSSAVCYLCAKLAQTLGTVYPKHDVALSDVFDSTAIDLPWTFPPDVPQADVVIEILRTIILKDFRRDALTYVVRDETGDALGTEVPECMLGNK